MRNLIEETALRLRTSEPTKALINVCRLNIHLLNTYCVPGPVQSTLYKLAHLYFTTTPEVMAKRWLSQSSNQRNQSIPKYHGFSHRGMTRGIFTSSAFPVSIYQAILSRKLLRYPFSTLCVKYLKSCCTV